MPSIELKIVIMNATKTIEVFNIASVFEMSVIALKVALAMVVTIVFINIAVRLLKIFQAKTSPTTQEPK